MRIRNYDKDHLAAVDKPLALVSQSTSADEGEPNDPFIFWTKHHLKPVLVDLTVFSTGQQVRRGNGMWNGPFSGRPELAVELALAGREALGPASEDTVEGFTKSLRGWWRMFDDMEKSASGVSPSLEIVESVADLGELHRQRAHDIGMTRRSFNIFLRVVNIARHSRRLRPLHWIPPEDEEPDRDLAPAWQTELVRLALKRGWFNAVDRWDAAQEILYGAGPRTTEDSNFEQAYKCGLACMQVTKNARPEGNTLLKPLNQLAIYTIGYGVAEVFRGFYPDSRDIRMAFHSCLASTGWNPSTLLALNAEENFVEAHPKDPRRYFMFGYKARSGSEQFTEGLYKSQGSAGVIIQRLLQVTYPLRQELRKEFEKKSEAYEQMQRSNSSRTVLNALKNNLIQLAEGIRSVWLYSATNHGITWLKASNYHQGRDSSVAFLDELVEEINSHQPADRQVLQMKAGDFRDAFAAYAYRISGGMVLYVMKALNHRRLASTRGYITNKLINHESQRVFGMFTEAIWKTIRIHKRLDPTLVAEYSRTGHLSEERHRRLAEYRALRRSRLNIGCKEPTNPPKHIAPNFVSDGKKMCGPQRCILCVENGVLFPDSLDGICMRTAELDFLKTQMSVAAWVESRFPEEYDNLEVALLGYDQQEVKVLVRKWTSKISDGTHRVVQFDGTEEEVA